MRPILMLTWSIARSACARSKVLDRVHALVEADGVVDGVLDGTALLVGPAGLFEDAGDVAGALRNQDGLIDAPALVDVDLQAVVGTHRRADGPDHGKIGPGIPAGLELEPLRARLLEQRHQTRHIVDLIEREEAARAVAFGQASGHARGNVPARDVEGGLGVAMAVESLVHRPVHREEANRIDADESGAEKTQRGPHATGKRRKVVRPEGTGFAPAAHALIGVDPDDGAVERAPHPPSGLAGPPGGRSCR